MSVSVICIYVYFLINFSLNMDSFMRKINLSFFTGGFASLPQSNCAQQSLLIIRKTFSFFVSLQFFCSLMRTALRRLGTTTIHIKFTRSLRFPVTCCSFFLLLERLSYHKRSYISVMSQQRHHFGFLVTNGRCKKLARI